MTDGLSPLSGRGQIALTKIRRLFIFQTSLFSPCNRVPITLCGISRGPVSVAKFIQEFLRSTHQLEQQRIIYKTAGIDTRERAILQ